MVLPTAQNESTYKRSRNTRCSYTEEQAHPASYLEAARQRKRAAPSKAWSQGTPCEREQTTRDRGNAVGLECTSNAEPKCNASKHVSAQLLPLPGCAMRTCETLQRLNGAFVTHTIFQPTRVRASVDHLKTDQLWLAGSHTHVQSLFFVYLRSRIE